MYKMIMYKIMHDKREKVKKKNFIWIHDAIYLLATNVGF